MKDNIMDDRGFNQGFKLVKSTEVRMRRRADWMISKMLPDSSKNVLEIGCGTGEVSYWIAEKTGMQVFATDLCIPFIDEAKVKLKLPNLEFEFLDFKNPEQVKNRTFDYIIGNGILHHLYFHLDDTLQTLNKLLNKDGKIIFIEPNIYNPYCALIFNFARKWAKLEPDEMAFSKPFITEKLKVAEFTKIKVNYKDFLLPGIPNFLIKPSIYIVDLAENSILLKWLSQSIFIEASK